MKSFMADIAVGKTEMSECCWENFTQVQFEYVLMRDTKMFKFLVLIDFFDDSDFKALVNRNKMNSWVELQNLSTD